MSVARGIVGPRTGLRPRARSGRPRGTEFDATEWEQIPVEILRAVEHQTVARASDQRGHRRGKGEHAPFSRYDAERLRPLRSTQCDGRVVDPIHAERFGEAERDGAVHGDTGGVRCRERRLKTRRIEGVWRRRNRGDVTQRRGLGIEDLAASDRGVRAGPEQDSPIAQEGRGVPGAPGAHRHRVQGSGVRCPYVGSRQSMPGSMIAAGDEDASVGEQRRRVMSPRGHPRNREPLDSTVLWVEDLRLRHGLMVRADAAEDQHGAVGQDSGRVPGACGTDRSEHRGLAGTRVVDEGGPGCSP
jgi:hypothetical protein